MYPQRLGLAPFGSPRTESLLIPELLQESIDRHGPHLVPISQQLMAIVAGQHAGVDELRRRARRSERVEPLTRHIGAPIEIVLRVEPNPGNRRGFAELGHDLFHLFRVATMPRRELW